MRDRIVIANWKMNGSREANARWTDEFLSSPRPACRTVVCAPFVYLGELALRALGTHLEVGAEDVNENPAGAFTGEISAGMLHDIGMSCAIVGHSERRTLYGETDNRVAMKALALVKAGLKPVVCVGETLEERETGATPSVILRQLNAVLTIVLLRIFSLLLMNPFGPSAPAKPLRLKSLSPSTRSSALGSLKCLPRAAHQRRFSTAEASSLKMLTSSLHSPILTAHWSAEQR